MRLCRQWHVQTLPWRRTAGDRTTSDATDFTRRAASSISPRQRGARQAPTPSIALFRRTFHRRRRPPRLLPGCRHQTYRRQCHHRRLRTLHTRPHHQHTGRPPRWPQSTRVSGACRTPGGIGQGPSPTPASWFTALMPVMAGLTAANLGCRVQRKACWRRSYSRTRIRRAQLYRYLVRAAALSSGQVPGPVSIALPVGKTAESAGAGAIIWCRAKLGRATVVPLTAAGRRRTSGRTWR